MAAEVITAPEGRIIHKTYAVLSGAAIPQRVHVTQYDESLPVIACTLYKDGQLYTIPDGASVRLRMNKNGLPVYHEAMGINDARHVVYLEITAQMTVLYGEFAMVIEVETSDGKTAGTSYLRLIVRQNPVQNPELDNIPDYTANSNRLTAEGVKKLQDESSTQQKAIEDKGKNTLESIPADYSMLSGKVDKNTSGINKLKEDLENQKVVPMKSVNPYKMNLDDYDAVITSGKYLTGRSTSTHKPTMTQGSDFPYDVVDIKINLDNATITVPYDSSQNVGQAFVLYTEGVQSNNATPDNVNKKQVGVIEVTENSYTINLNASALGYERAAFTVPKGRRDFYFKNPDEGEIGELIDKKVSISNEKMILNNIVIAPVNMFYSIGAIGDSYTAGSALSSDGETWQDVTEISWIATIGKRAGIYWSNYGKGGATTKSYITDKLPTVLSGQAKDLYFIDLGINDYLQKITVGTVADIKEDYTENGESYFGWYGSIIAQVQAHAPKAKIVLVKIWTDGTAKIPYDNAIDEIAEHFGLPVINPFDDAFFNSSLYLDNMVSGHPTPMTYPCMGLAMERLFSRCVIENPTYFKYASIG